MDLMFVSNDELAHESKPVRYIHDVELMLVT